MIADKHVDQIMYVIDGSTIKKKELRDDLVDHFCCLVEMDMQKGLGFDEAFQRAYEQTCPGGLDEIQRETVLLLNYNRILFMKKLTYLIGFFASMLLALGLFFKLMYWPGATAMSIMGTIGLVFLFLPMILVNRFKYLATQSAMVKVKWIFGVLSALVFAGSVLFKMLHLQGASVLLALSFLLFCLGFLPLLFFRMYRKSVEEL